MTRQLLLLVLTLSCPLALAVPCGNVVELETTAGALSQALTTLESVSPERAIQTPSAALRATVATALQKAKANESCAVVRALAGEVGSRAQALAEAVARYATSSAEKTAHATVSAAVTPFQQALSLAPEANVSKGVCVGAVAGDKRYFLSFWSAADVEQGKLNPEGLAINRAIRWNKCRIAYVAGECWGMGEMRPNVLFEREMELAYVDTDCSIKALQRAGRVPPMGWERDISRQWWIRSTDLARRYEHWGHLGEAAQKTQEWVGAILYGKEFGTLREQCEAAAGHWHQSSDVVKDLYQDYYKGYAYGACLDTNGVEAPATTSPGGSNDSPALDPNDPLGILEAIAKEARRHLQPPPQ